MTKPIAAMLVLLALGGCATSQEVCQGYGFRPGTDAFANCLQTQAIRMDNALRSMQAPDPVSCYTRGNYTTCY